MRNKAKHTTLMDSLNGGLEIHRNITTSLLQNHLWDAIAARAQEAQALSRIKHRLEVEFDLDGCLTALDQMALEATHDPIMRAEIEKTRRTIARIAKAKAKNGG